MQDVSPDFMRELLEQLALLSTFLGGFSATFLATLLTINEKHKLVSWMIGLATIAACFFVIAVVSCIGSMVSLHPDMPQLAVNSGPTLILRLLAAVGFFLGMLVLISSIGLSGWLKGKKLGILTSCVAFLTIVILLWMTVGISD